jgi:hypothetical protein
VLPTGQKLTLGLLATIALEVVTFRAYVPYLELLQFFKCILEAVFCEEVQHRPLFCLHHLNCAKMAPLQFYFQSGKQREVGWVGDDSHVVFWLKSSLVRNEVWDGALSWRSIQFICRQIWGEVFTHFHRVAFKRHSSMRNLLFGLLERILCEQSSWCQWKWWACSWLCSSSVSPFSVSVSLAFQCAAPAFFPERLSNHCQVLRRTFLEIVTNLVLLLCRIHSEIASPNKMT